MALLLLAAGCATTELPPPTPVVADATPVAVAAGVPAAAASAPDASTDSDAAPAVADDGLPAVVDPLRPERQVDLDDEAARADLWARVKRGFAMPDLDNALVRNQEQWYANRPDYVQRMTERGSRYLYHIVEEVERRGMPTELALLPFIESAFNPQAMSSAKASGMWQFMPSTGRNFALTQNVFRDDRRDVLESTRAALDYLAKLHDMFGDWHLALAAYNWGEGNVARAVARNARARKPTNYASLRMPNETKYYVPKLQAVKNIVLHPEAFSLSLPALANHPHFLSVSITRDIDVDLAARYAGMTTDDFKELNPQMNKPVILAAGTPRVLLPYDNANAFVRQIEAHRGPMASWTAWVAPKTMRPADVAKQVGMSEAELREVNRIPPRMLVKAGSTLLVPRAETREADVSEHLAANATMALVSDGPALRRVSVKAGKQDSVASIARRYKLSTEQVAQWNKVGASASFKPGQTVFVYLASGSKHTASVARKGPAKATRTARAKAPPVRTAKVAKADNTPARQTANGE
ncbi:MAG TPA: transglycosylase SLT domain-containing protein [Albitalea sp.]|nr:transglycosylase SLT domain-containing protein [Albitalea sp.]HJW12511.1 transglycosylase SLT domain-containing protein [Albitalea sp.]